MSRIQICGPIWSTLMSYPCQQWCLRTSVWSPITQVSIVALCLPSEDHGSTYKNVAHILYIIAQQEMILHTAQKWNDKGKHRSYMEISKYIFMPRIHGYGVSIVSTFKKKRKEKFTTIGTPQSFCLNIFTFWLQAKATVKKIKLTEVNYTHSTLCDDFSIDEKLFSVAIICDQLWFG